MRTMILLIVFTTYPSNSWMWAIGGMWYILSCAKWWLMLHKSTKMGGMWLIT